jgi:hypothetical protein
LGHSQPPEARTCAVYTRQSVKTEGDLTSCEVQRQMCVDFVRSAGRQAYRLLDERLDDVGESGVELRIAAMPDRPGAILRNPAKSLIGSSGRLLRKWSGIPTPAGFESRSTRRRSCATQNDY